MTRKNRFAQMVDDLTSGIALPGEYDKHTSEEILDDITSAKPDEESTETWSFAEAEAIARKLAGGEVSMVEMVPGLKEWQSEEAIRDAIKHGDVSVKQFQDELERRGEFGVFGVPKTGFVDRYPIT